MKKTFEPLQVVINSLDPAGYGVANTPFGKVAVPGSLDGEVVQVLPVKRKKKLRYSRLLSVESSSPHRIEPFCEAANLCGGCSFQHFDTQAQIEFKQGHLMSLLGDTRPEKIIEPICGDVHHYRAKARLGVKHVTAKGRVLVGFREKLGGYITDISNCDILVKPLDQFIDKFEALIENLSSPQSIPQLEIASGDLSRAVVIRHLSDLTAGDLKNIRSFGKRHSIDMYLQPGNESTVWKCFPDSGEDLLFYRLEDWNLTFGFHPLDFIQVNQQINQKLISKVVDLLEANDGDRIIDLFCGIGNFSLPLAKICQFVTGVELVEAAIDRAQENAKRNGIKNIVFRKADLFSDDCEIESELNSNNKLLLDPPRSGALNVVEKLVNSSVERVVYVSCNPTTLARDAEILCSRGGFKLCEAGVVDMFPQTAHVESIASFIR